MPTPLPSTHFQELCWLPHILFSLNTPYVLWLPWLLELLPVIKESEKNDYA